MRNVFLALTLLCNYILANFWHVAAKCAKIEHLEKQNKNFSESYKFHDKNMLNCETILSWIHLNTSSAGCLETCPSTGRRPTVYTWPAYDILVLHFKCQPLSAGSYVFLYTVRHFIQVSCKQKHIFIMFVDVRFGQESISKQPWYILPAVTHAFRRVLL